MNKKVILTVGLPCSGKSTYIEKMYINNNPYKFEESELPPTIKETLKKVDNAIIRNYFFKKYVYFDKVPKLLTLISADYIKEYANVEHLKSTEIAEELLYEVFSKFMDNEVCETFLMDGGGINNRYTLRIIDEIRRIDPHVIIEVLYFNTPIEVCIKRMENRKRKVPIESIYEKNQKLTSCVNKLKEVCDNFVQINYFTNKHIFLDMDGTMCSYVDINTDEDGNLDFVNSATFKYTPPVEHMVELMSEIDPNRLYILTACPNSISWGEKQEWIKKHLPFIKEENIYFAGNKDYKHVFLKHLLLKLKLEKEDVCVVDDSFDIIKKMKTIGVNAIHPSNIKSII